MNPGPTLANFDVDAFLRDSWQQRPRLIKNPWGAAGWHNPLEPDELAGLATEEGIETRLITQATAATGDGSGWQVEHGPLGEDRFARLGSEPWTMLVQAVDHHVPEVAALIEPFRFIPDWRIDDVMVSYATDGAGVGAHYDQYDVFLIQGLGKRRWQVGARCDETTPLLPHSDLRLLANFEAEEEWVLEPGDILYVPPGFAHNGVAVGDDCMTYSIGFRAPSRFELITDWCDAIVDTLTEDDRYNDADPARQHLTSANPGEITPQALDRLQAMILDALSDKQAFARWFGSHATTPKYPDMDWAPEEAMSEEAIREAMESGTLLTRNPASRFSYVREDSGKTVLFVDGEMFECEGDEAVFAIALCDGVRIEPFLASLHPNGIVPFISRLMNQGKLALSEIG